MQRNVSQGGGGFSSLRGGEEQCQFSRLLGQLPARLTAEQAARVVNCQPHDVPILVAARLLKPLGNPAQNEVKFFAMSELLEQVKDRAWLVKVTNAVNQHWHLQNARKNLFVDRKEVIKYNDNMKSEINHKSMA
ncbi:MAG TPA: hypothetical protein VMH30_06845 [Verrucomicrobiae bacterium]|nr:hypothetical protein [Verrucomicrobiae bacterium]